MTLSGFPACVRPALPPLDDCPLVSLASPEPTTIPPEAVFLPEELAATPLIIPLLVIGFSCGLNGCFFGNVSARCMISRIRSESIDAEAAIAPVFCYDDVFDYDCVDNVALDPLNPDAFAAL